MTYVKRTNRNRRRIILDVRLISDVMTGSIVKQFFVLTPMMWLDLIYVVLPISGSKTFDIKLEVTLASVHCLYLTNSLIAFDR